jgi:hypothetical protein
MTTIAVRDGVMAADTLGYQGDKCIRSKKLFRVNGAIIGICGCWTDGKLFVDWYEAGFDRDKPPDWRTQGDEKVDFQALVLTPEGVCWWSYELVSDPVLDDCYAMGSGGSAALAAMYCGCGAEEAVGIAIKVDPHSGGDVETMELAK